MFKKAKFSAAFAIFASLLLASCDWDSEKVVRALEAANGIVSGISELNGESCTFYNQSDEKVTVKGDGKEFELSPGSSKTVGIKDINTYYYSPDSVDCNFDGSSIIFY